MAEVQDLELLKTVDEPPIEPAPDRPSRLWLVVAALAVATAAAVYIAVERAHRAAPATANQGGLPPQPPARPLGGKADAINLPPLDQTDPIVRDLVKQIASHPRIAAWLATDGLIRTVTLAVANVTDGVTPAARFRVLRPTSGFETVTRDGAPRIEPAQLRTVRRPRRRRGLDRPGGCRALVCHAQAAYRRGVP